MQRRTLFALLGGTTAAAPAWPLAALSPPAKTLRVGAASPQPRTTPFTMAFERRLAELGYQEGRNVTFDFVHIPSLDAYEAGYRDVVARKADVVLASGPEFALKSALAATRSIPIVMIAVDYEPLASGYVTSLARPGGNVTGVFFQQIELTMKRVQLIRDAFSAMQAATLFWDRISADQWESARDTGAKLGLRLAGIELRERPYDYERALAQAPPDHRGHLFVMASPIFFAGARASANSCCAIVSPGPSPSANGPRRAAWCPKGRTSAGGSGAPRTLSIASRGAPSLSIFQSSSRPSSSFSSTSRPRKRSASQYRRCCSPAPTR